ncbi:MAG TPA: hypothetical protein VFR85_15290 [Anaeromyxobacteraceae bacterium]|nr:hypothetical protein [Anaeromyxobacteraceae bacterium]
MHVYLYIMAASTDPDVCERSVPFAIDEQEIFFGPCKKNLRSDLRKRFLSQGARSVIPTERIYLVGLNGGNAQRVRKVLWAGRVKKLMTFENAYDGLKGERYQFMRERPATPMHLVPIRESGSLIGYQHVGKLHSADWILDIAGRRKSSKYEVNGETVRLSRGVSAATAFARDACMLLDNIFTAAGAGIPIDEEIVGLLRDVQHPARADEIDAYAVFGYQQNGDVDGRRGRWLLLKGPEASRLLGIITDRGEALKPKQRPIDRLETSDSCRCDPEERDEDGDENGGC